MSRVTRPALGRAAVLYFSFWYAILRRGARESVMGWQVGWCIGFARQAGLGVRGWYLLVPGQEL
jgi:hypothetical protein